MKRHQMPTWPGSEVLRVLMLTIVMAAWAPLCWSDGREEAEPVLLVTGEWAPFTSQAIDRSGYFTAVVARVFERMDQPYEIRFMPWKRTTAMIEKGDAFAAFPYRITDQRQQKHHFSNVVATSSGCLFYLDSRFPDGFQWQDYDDLEGYKIGGTLGYWYEDDFREADLNAEFVRNDEVNFRKLVFGRVDMVAAGDRVGWHVLHQNFPEIANKVSVAEKPLDQSRLHLMVSRDYPRSEQLLERFNRHLQQFKKSSAFKRLKSQYDPFSRSNARPPQGEPE